MCLHSNAEIPKYVHKTLLLDLSVALQISVKQGTYFGIDALVYQYKI
jgi:hypothetical protein